MAVYEPPCVYALPEWLAQLVRTQGVRTTLTILTAKVVAHAGDGDHKIHDHYEFHRAKLAAALAAGQGG
jgi:hypothetical protein